MIVTLILSLLLMAVLFLMIWIAVSLVQSKKLFTTALKDIQAAALKHKERFPGGQSLGLVFAATVCCFAPGHIYLRRLGREIE